MKQRLPLAAKVAASRRNQIVTIALLHTVIDGDRALLPLMASFDLVMVQSAPERARTPDPQIRSLVLYPTELPAQARLTTMT
jgi:hypothetical protein